jgi:hypothetical protein
MQEAEDALGARLLRVEADARQPHVEADARLLRVEADARLWVEKNGDPL